MRRSIVHYQVVDIVNVLLFLLVENQTLLCLKCVLFLIINKVDATFFITAVKERWRQRRSCFSTTVKNHRSPEGSILSSCDINV